jgi:hypothetical protein
MTRKAAATFVDGIDGSRGGDKGGGRSRDLHVNEGVGDVVDAVVRDGGRVRWSASMLLRAGEKETFEVWSPCLFSS